MRILAFYTLDNILQVEIKTDIFSTKEDLMTQGHDTNFTQMYIDNISNQCIKFGLGFQEIVYTWQSLIKYAQDYGFGLQFMDDTGNEEVVVATKNVTTEEYTDSTFKGTAGEKYITFNNGKVFDVIKEKDIIVIDGVGYQITGFQKDKLQVSLNKSLLSSFNESTINLVIGTNSAELNEITITGDNNVNIGETLQLSYELDPIDYIPNNITWSSENDLVATIDENGIIVGVLSGPVIINLDIDGVTTTYSITVN